MPPAKRLAVGADHGGFALKQELVRGLRELGYPVEDLGAHSAEASDYPDVAHAAARGLLAGRFDGAILVCGTGIGMAIAANRHPGVRAANCSDTFSARYSRLHNDANVLTLGARVVGPGLAWDVVKAWLETPFEGGERHVRRIGKLDPSPDVGTRPQ